MITANEKYLLLQAQHAVPAYRDRQKVIDALKANALETAKLVRDLVAE